MKIRYHLPLLLLAVAFLSPLFMNGQASQDIASLDAAYKSCMQAGTDSSACGRNYLRQMDSILTVVYEKVRVQSSAKEKVDLLNDQKSWLGKKSEFYKKQDENFTFHLQDGSWKKDMIWLVYQNKADFLRKRALQLAKQLKE